MMRSRHFVNAFASRLVRLCGFGLLFSVSLVGCSDDSKTPLCENCENWDEVVEDLGRQAETHPTDPNFLVYSTIRKTPNAPDANRQFDEDLWLVWRGSADRSQWVRWQLTGDEISSVGDNFQARWSPSGSQIAFIHTSPGGVYQVWRLDVTLPVGNPPAASFDPSGAAELVVDQGRDPAWLNEETVLFTRENQIFRADLAAPGIRGGVTVTKLTFNSPGFVTSEDFVDRHPFVASDGAIVFSNSGRVEVGDLFVGAFAISEGAFPETTAVRALLGIRPPTSPVISYPLVEGGDTLITPGAGASDPYLLIRALPFAGGSSYDVGVRRDSRFFSASEELFCDTLVSRSATLTSGGADTVNLYFKIARGVLRVSSGRNATNIHWERVDGLAFGTLGPIDRCVSSTEDCLLSWAVNETTGDPQIGTLETYIVRGTTVQGDTSIVETTLAPGETTTVRVFCEGDTCGCSVAEPEPGRSLRPAWIEKSAVETARGAQVGRLRANEGNSGVWKMDLTDPNRPELSPLFISELEDESIQFPALSPVLAGGTRYLAYTSNRTGLWTLQIQKLNANLELVGDPVAVVTPGSSDNFVCRRSVYQPTWVSGSGNGALRLLVTMTSCPENTFPGFEIDDDPWSLGDLNVWEVSVPLP